jgi:hypothetical protein
MVLFFQFDVRPEFKLGVAAGSHFVVFMSAAVNEIHSFDAAPNGSAVPDQFWKKRLPHFKVMLFGPDAKLVAAPSEEPRLVPHRLVFAAKEEPTDPFLFVGGEPIWYQDEERHPGFDFLCQLSVDFPFRRRPSAAPQRDSFSKDAYCLFLGNAAYFFARPAPVDPEEVWIVLQN